ncbi:hypothetical protein SAMN05216327_106403 [Dyadobacter sp. SG02]|uniref:response regulator transcription factor n=1 Tax=Dyadobacter sp. SG02 TaxID=1855291 RepID=UPI0008CAAC67|nr:response regulator transcription factor [Dyadobacter sp. SG02]SEJ16055.1 hypothetical protein SAMN05216327_106403 [Dyadobacter sp. SG02]
MNVVLIDKHPVFRTGIRLMLESQLKNINTLETGSMHGLTTANNLGDIDIVIIGLSEEQPEIDKVVLKRAMKKNPLASFIVYAAKPRLESVRLLMRMGVKGYLNKNGSPEELTMCMNAVVAGQPFFYHQA